MTDYPELLVSRRVLIVRNLHRRPVTWLVDRLRDAVADAGYCRRQARRNPPYLERARELLRFTDRLLFELAGRELAPEIRAQVDRCVDVLAERLRPQIGEEEGRP